MKSITIQGAKRESVGKKSTRALRDAELVPCVVYGGNTEPISFSTEEKSFKDLVYTPDAHTVELVIDGETIPAVLQDIQFHPVTDRILHADFYMLNEDKPVVMEVPIKFTGRSKGVVAGGVLRPSFRKLRLKALPANLPDLVEVDITPLNIGNKIYIGDIKTEEYTFMHPDNAVVVAVKTSRTAVASDDDEDEDGDSEEGASEEGEENKDSAE